MTFGDPRRRWAAAADVSAETHVRYLDAPVRRVLSLIPTKYDDMWTGAKGFYKVEPIVADGGQVVLYAPHIHEIATTHPAIEQIGYHCRDYFVKQWDRFKDSALGRPRPLHPPAWRRHLRRGHGERDRVTVTLATGIPEDVTRAINLDYLDPAAGRSRRLGRPIRTRSSSPMRARTSTACDEPGRSGSVAGPGQ